MHLRQHGQDFVFPNIKYEFYKCHSIACLLFSYVQILSVCCYAYVYVFYDLIIIHYVVGALFLSKRALCHVYFTISLLKLTY